MSVSLRWEQCCESAGCKRPAHYGELCAVCFMAATPARRVVELDTSRVASLDALEALWLLPALGCGDS